MTQLHLSAFIMATAGVVLVSISFGISGWAAWLARFFADSLLLAAGLLLILP
ncbi:hypothetical protein ACFQS7_29025 [Dankookia sp. GCM10030260]|uniref:hypothetical protein n=1 Tax=Dankookia sp. GCM10030260 TaxID=3273390 RepID=UPI00361D0BFA